MELNTEHFKEKLLAEQKHLEEELESVARKNPASPNHGDWEPVPDQMDVQSSESNEVADRLEDFEENVEITDDLETRLESVRKALDRIDAGTYGTCEVGGETIPIERLEANPSATTCLAHTQ